MQNDDVRVCECVWQERSKHILLRKWKSNSLVIISNETNFFFSFERVMCVWNIWSEFYIIQLPLIVNASCCVKATRKPEIIYKKAASLMTFQRNGYIAIFTIERKLFFFFCCFILNVYCFPLYRIIKEWTTCEYLHIFLSTKSEYSYRVYFVQHVFVFITHILCIIANLHFARSIVNSMDAWSRRIICSKKKKKKK